ncbi:hypothetical protein [Roseovarius sp. THAF8]|uniref:hypothetical protein n=1 Tax=Roseovarius sp. THAF8 TaxID=2587846 RepID=UPI001267B0E3|nr:hypothetical protein [Roseovarius sp. THAF8]
MEKLMETRQLEINWADEISGSYILDGPAGDQVLIAAVDGRFHKLQLWREDYEKSRPELLLD